MMLLNPYRFAVGVGSGVTPIVWSSTDKHANITLLESGKLAYNSVGTSWVSARSTTSFTTGGGTDIMIEVEVLSSKQIIVGFMKSTAALTGYVGQDANGWGYYANTGNKANGGTLSAYGATLATGDKFRAKLYSNGTLEFFKNGVSQGNAFTGLSGTFYPAIALFDGSSANGGRAT